MSGNTENGSGRLGSRWRIAIWGAAAFLLLLPLLAMQFTEEVAQDLTDFVVFGTMLVGAYELAARVTSNTVFRFAMGVALAVAFILVWLSLGVGIIGKDGDPPPT